MIENYKGWDISLNKW